MRFDELVDLCVAARAEALARESNLAPADRERAAMASVLRVAAARSPGVARYLEGHREPTVVDQLDRPRLLARARAHIDLVLREANVDGDVTEQQLLTSTIPWVVPHRDRLCWLLSREAGMSEEDIAVVVIKTQQGVSKAIDRHQKRRTAVAAAPGKERAHGR